MKIYLDDAAFPPTAKTLKAATGASQVISAPWPEQYKGWPAGIHELADAAPVAPVADDDLQQQVEALQQQLDDLQARITLR